MERSSKKIRIAIDVIIWFAATLLCLLWRWAADKSEINGYWFLFGGLIILWVLFGWIFQLYRSYKETWLWQAVLSVIATTGLLIGLCYWLLPYLSDDLSFRVASWTIMIVGVCELIVVLITHYWKYATNLTVPVMEIEQRANAQVAHAEEKRSLKSMESIHQSVLSVTTEEDYLMLCEKARLDSRQTKMVCDRDRFSFLQIPD